MHLRVGEILRAKGLTAYWLSKAVGDRMERTSVYRVARGDKVKLTPDEIAALCENLQVSPNQLFGYERGKA